MYIFLSFIITELLIIGVCYVVLALQNGEYKPEELIKQVDIEDAGSVIFIILSMVSLVAHFILFWTAYYNILV